MIPDVLTIAGSDSCGGAGIQADLKTFTALRVHGCSVVAALTAQNTLGVHDTFAVAPDFVRAQLQAVLGDLDVRAAKIGMLADAAIVHAVAGELRRHRPVPLVVDPVMLATTGATLLEPGALGALREELFPLATIVTPNAMEAGALLGAPPLRTVREMRDAAHAIHATGVPWVLVKGGDVPTGRVCVDILVGDGGEFTFRARRLAGEGHHGTGCTLSAAIAVYLARELPVPEACVRAVRYVRRAIRGGVHLRGGGGVPLLWHGATPRRISATPHRRQA